MTNEMFDVLINISNSSEGLYSASDVDAHFAKAFKLLLAEGFIGTSERLIIGDDNIEVKKIIPSFYVTEMGFIEMERYRNLSTRENL